MFCRVGVYRISSCGVWNWHVYLRAADRLAVVQVPVARRSHHLLGDIAQHRRLWRRLPAAEVAELPATSVLVAGPR